MGAFRVLRLIVILGRSPLTHWNTWTEVGGNWELWVYALLLLYINKNEHIQGSSSPWTIPRTVWKQKKQQ